ncbi:DUF2335 domain-containing protein [Stutzerimonas nosocomialis]|uniref:DUF2335 domain-containing protein n=1 Tax=Stutzerimonas nosocomialis TaxID=1056496 RepID=UPI0019D61D76|nr:DUF2335 domain-containing protein [Stutzerimonas nosocomialis]
MADAHTKASEPVVDQELADEVRDALAEIEPDENNSDLGVLLRSPEARQTVERMVSTAVAVYEERHSGPLPSPRQLREYEDVVPGGAERIFQMAEREQSHRHEQQKAMASLRGSVFQHVQVRENRGQLIATAMSLLVMFFGGWLIHLGNPNLGTGLIVGTMVSIASVFITSRADKKKEEPPATDE